VLDLWRRRGPSGDLLVVAEPEGEHAGEPGPLVRP
jgi:hypothetical protein